MTRIDKLKEDIAFEKQVFFMFFAAGFAILGWLFSNATKAELHLVYIAGVAAMIDVVVLAFFGRRIKNKIQELENL